MTITELANIELLAPYTLESPEIQAFFLKLSERQAAWSGHPLLFFQSTHAPEQVYLLTGWESIPAHGAWMASDENQRMLKQVAVMGKVNSLEHLDVNFTKVPRDTQLVMLEKRNGAGEKEERTEEGAVEWKSKVVDEGATATYWIRAYTSVENTSGTEGAVLARRIITSLAKL